MESFSTEKVMKMLRQEIYEQGFNYGMLRFTTSYYRRIISRVMQAKEIIIFGAGDYGKLLLNDFKLYKNINIVCFCDNEKNGYRIDGVYIINPKEAREKYPDATYVISPKGYENEILKQLTDMNISISNILIAELNETGLTLA